MSENIEMKKNTKIAPLNLTRLGKKSKITLKPLVKAGRVTKSPIKTLKKGEVKSKNIRNLKGIMETRNQEGAKRNL